MFKKSVWIGIDIGGTKIQLQTFNKKLEVVETILVKTKQRSQAAFLEQLYELIDGVFHRKIKGIGVAVPGIVDQKNGVLIKAPHLPTKRDLKLRSLLEKRYGIDVLVDNDINAFLAAEYQKSRLSKHQNILGVMLGTGLGGAAIVNGKLMRGKDGFAGEFGHMMINNTGSFEQNCSGYYLAKYPARKAKLAENFGLGLANLNLIFNPDVIVLGGSVYLGELKGKKKRLETIIKKHSLAKQSPKLIDASSRTSVPLGSVLLLSEEL